MPDRQGKGQPRRKSGNGLQMQPKRYFIQNVSRKSLGKGKGPP
jgi:hypothetical protein